jgi:peptide-methionine (S)-S-oxide reductase
MLMASKIAVIISLCAAIGCSVASSSSRTIADVKELAPTAPLETESPKEKQTAVFAGGCFWGVEAVFEHVKGVSDAKSGYAGGNLANPTYEQVSEGSTGHAESVKVTFDPTVVTYSQLLSIFFSVAHDPTELNYQGPDHGTQYRSAIFYANDEQKKLAEQYIAAIDKAKVFPKPVVTQLAPLKTFWEAEDYHQNYLKAHPKEPYIVINDIPKVEALKERFKDLYTEK